MASKDSAKAGKAKVQAAQIPGWPPVVGLTVEEAAAALRVDEKTVRAAIKKEGLPARMVGKGYRIDPEALRIWIANGQDGRGPSVEELNAEMAVAADADAADPEVQDALRAGLGGGK